MAIATKDNGLVIFIRRIPSQPNTDALRRSLLTHLAVVGIKPDEVEIHKPRGKGIATMFITDRQKGERFLKRMKQFPSNLGLHRFNAEFERNESQDGGAMVRDRIFIEKVETNAHSKGSSLVADFKGIRSQSVVLVDLLTMNLALSMNGHSQTAVQTTFTQKSFNIDAVNCGNWAYDRRGSPIFVSEYSANRPGQLLVGHRSIVVVLMDPYRPGKWHQRIDFAWDCTDIIYTQQGRLPSLMITCKHSPRLYRNIEQGEQNGSRTNKNARKKSRIPCLDSTHSKIVGSCFTWEFVFEPRQHLRPIQALVEHIPDGPSSMRISVASRHANKPFDEALKSLNQCLSHAEIPFCVKFQALKIALNGHVPPDAIEQLVPHLMSAIKAGKTEQHCAEALRKMDRDLPWPGPHTKYKEINTEALKSTWKAILGENLTANSTFLAVRKSDTMAMVHRMVVTPTGLYLEGPDPEVCLRTCRQIRKS